MAAHDGGSEQHHPSPQQFKPAAETNLCLLKELCEHCVCQVGAMCVAVELQMVTAFQFSACHVLWHAPDTARNRCFASEFLITTKH